MKLQDQVCTLEQAKRLKELGVYQGYSHFEYGHNDNVFHDVVRDQYPGTFNPLNIDLFTVAELGVMLPPLLSRDGDTPRRILIRKDIDGQFNCNWEFETNFKSLNEAQVRAAMLIYLLENNLTTPEECNQRLII